MRSLIDRFARSALRLCRDTSAGAASEFAFTAPILIAMIVATLEVGVIFICKAYLETGTEQAARMVLTNNATSTTNGTTSPMTSAQFKAAVCAELPALFNCANLIVELEPLPSGSTSVSSLLPQFNNDGSLNGTPAYTTGTSGQLMLLVVMYQYPVFGGLLNINFGNMGNGTLLMTSSQIFRIEV